VWQNEMVRIVRFLVNDLDSISYTDDRLEETILVSAQLMLINVDFGVNYTIDVDQFILSPDPTEGTKDNDFIAIVVTKAACIILGSEAKTLAAQGFRVKDGTSSIDTTAAYQSIHQLHKELNDELASLIVGYQAGNSIGGGAVMTPYTQSYITNGMIYGQQGNEIRNFY
jgi:hypothetical protein